MKNKTSKSLSKSKTDDSIDLLIKLLARLIIEESKGNIE